MRKIVLASHGRLAAGMKSSVEMVVGVQERLHTINAYVDGCSDPAQELKGYVDELGEGEELVIVTDVLGGSVNNEASQFVNVPGVFVVTGMNLSFVLTLVIDEATPAQELIDATVVEARKQLMQVKPVGLKSEEDF